MIDDVEYTDCSLEFAKETITLRQPIITKLTGQKVSAFVISNKGLGSSI